MIHQRMLQFSSVARGVTTRRFWRKVASVLGKSFGSHRPGAQFGYLLDVPAPVLPVGPSTISSGSTTILNWILPEFGYGSGGHATIFRLSAGLSARGYANHFWFIPGVRFSLERKMHDCIQEWFTPQPCEVDFVTPETLDRIEGDVCMATEYRTAFYAAAVRHVRQRSYLIQDYEPWFFARGSEHLLAEETYRLPLHPIAASRWLAGFLGPYYGREIPSFQLAFDHGHYFADSTPRPVRPTVAFYLRELTSRRCAELGWLALEEVARHIPDLEVHCFGQPRSWLKGSFKCIQHGILPGERLGQLYRTMRVGMVLSGTNQSLIPAEMMACGLPVVELDTPATQADFPPGTIEAATPHPRDLAVALRRLLTNETVWSARQAAGLSFSGSLSWDAAVMSIDQALQGILLRRPLS